MLALRPVRTCIHVLVYSYGSICTLHHAVRAAVRARGRRFIRHAVVGARAVRRARVRHGVKPTGWVHARPITILLHTVERGTPLCAAYTSHLPGRETQSVHVVTEDVCRDWLLTCDAGHCVDRVATRNVDATPSVASA